MSGVIKLRGGGDQAAHSVMAFECECSRRACDYTVTLSVEEYGRVYHLARRFAVTPDHVRLDVEKIIIAFSNYVIVTNFSSHD
jgi:hypothetical protein